MSNVDQRVVSMRFDNKQFEDGIKTSTNSIEKLNQSLKMEGAAKGLSNLDKAAKGVSLAGIASGVDALNAKFSTLGIIGITALQNIANSALNAGNRIISALTIDPVKTGFDEYETKMNAIKTILSNTQGQGTSLDDVNAALAELNTYADKTVYNFAQMTDMVGKFSATSGKLDESVSIVKGMANLAAASGVDNTRLQSALYQTSQAMSGSFFQKIDWVSLENAGLATKKFRDDLISMGEQMGVFEGMGPILEGLKDGTIGFGQTLEKGWLTTDVFQAVTAMYALDDAMTAAAGEVNTFTKMLEVMKESVQSGWAVTWENIIGNKDESTAFFTALTNGFNNIIGPSTNARNEMLAFWKANNGRKALIEGLTNVFKGLESILKPIGEAFREIFPQRTGQDLVEMTNAFLRLTRHFKIGEETAANIKTTFKGLFAVLDIGVKVVTFVAKAVGMLIGALLPGTTGILDLTAGIGQFFVSLNDSIERSNIMTVALQKLGVAFAVVRDVVAWLISYIGPLTSSLGYALAGIGQSFMNLFGGAKVFAAELTSTGDGMTQTVTPAERLKTVLEGVHQAFSKISAAVVTVAKTIKAILVPIFDSIKKKFDELSMGDIGALMTGAGFLMLARSFSKGLGSFSDVLEQVVNTLKAFQLKVKADALLKIAIALGILAAALVALSYIKVEDLAKSLATLSIVFAELVGGLILLNTKIKTLKSLNLMGQMLALGIGIALLAASVKTLASLDAAKLAQGVVAIGALMVELALFMEFTYGNDLKTSAAGLTGFAVGLMVLSGALLVLSKIDPERLKEGILALAALMGVIGVFINMTRGGSLATSAGGLIAFSIGIAILFGSLAILAKLDQNAIGQGLVTLTALMTTIAVFIGVTNGGQLAKSAGGLIAFSTGLLVLIGAMTILGKMNVANVIQGTAAIASLMTIIAVFINLTRKGDLKGSASGLIGFSIGIVVLTGAMALLAKIDSARLTQAVGALGALIGIIGLFVDLTRAGDLKGSAAGLTGFAVGLTVLCGAVAILAAIDSGRIIQGVGALMAVIMSIGLFINLTREGDLAKSAAGLIGFSTGLMILAGVIAILSALNTTKLIMASAAISTLMATIGLFVNLTKGGDLKASAAGLIAFSIGIGLLAASLVAIGQLEAGRIMAAGAAITVLIAAVAGFVILTKGGDLNMTALGLVMFAGAMAVLSQVLIHLGSVDTVTIAKGVLGMSIALIALGLTAYVLAPLSPALFSLTAAVVAFGAGCLAIGAGMAAFGLGLALLAKAGPAGAEALRLALKSVIELIPLALQNLAKGLVDFARTIADGAPEIARAFVAIFKAMLDTIAIAIPQLVDSTLKLITAFLKAIGNNISGVIDAGVNLILNFISGIISKLPDVIDAAFKTVVAFINGLAEAIRGNTAPLADAVGNLIGAVVEAIGGLAYKVFDAGRNLILGFTKGIRSSTASSDNAAIEMARSAVEAAKKELDIQSPSGIFDEDVGAMVGAGMAQGIKKSTPKAVTATKQSAQEVTKAAKDEFEQTKDWIDERKYYNQLSLAEELAAWEKAQVKYAEGTELRKKFDKEVYRVKMEMIKAEYDNSVKWIEERKYYNQLSLDEELAAWQRVQKRYTEGSDERTKADREVYRVKKELVKAELDNSVSFIEKRKYYNQMGLQEELDAWERVQKRYAEGTDEREKADREVYRVKQEMIKAAETAEKEAFDKSVEWIDERKYYNKMSLSDELAAWQAIQSKYIEGSEQRKRADREVYRVQQEILRANVDFAKQISDVEEAANEKKKALEDDYYAKTKDVNDKLKQDIDSLNKAYDDALDSRTKSLYGTYGLFDKVDAKGKVDGATLIKNLEDQVTTFESWQQSLNTLSQRGISGDLLDELRAMGPKSSAEIDALNSLTEEDLKKYVSLWQKKHSEAKEQALSELDRMRIETSSKIVALRNQANIDLDGLKTTWKTKTQEITDDTKSKVDKINADWKKAVGDLTTATETEFATMSTTVQAKVGEMVTNMQTIMLTPDWAGVGSSIIDAITTGIKSAAAELAYAAAEAARNALQAAKIAVGGSVTQSLGSGLKSVASAVTDNIDTSPIITPVLDLSNVIAGAGVIGGILAAGQVIKATSSANLASSVNTGTKATVNTTSTPSSTPTQKSITQNLTINSPTALSPSETARQNRRVLQEFALQV